MECVSTKLKSNASALKMHPALLVALSLVASMLLYFLYALYRGLNFFEVFAGIGLKAALFTLLLLFLAETIKAVRLYLIVRMLGGNVTLWSCIVARLVGNFTGILTPGNIGAEPARVLSLASLNGHPIESLIAAGVIESFYDALVLSLVALSVGVQLLPRTVIVVLLSAIVLLLWAAGLTGLVFKESFWKRAVGYVARRALSQALQRELLERYRIFTLHVSRGLNAKLNLTGLALTLVSIAITALSFIPLAAGDIASLQTLDLNDVSTYAVAYSMSFVMSVLPTPGGSGFFELGLDIVLPAKLVLSWRMCFIAFSTIPTLILVALTIKVRKVLIENILKSISRGYA